MVFRTLLTKVFWLLSLISVSACALLPLIFLDGRYDSLRSHFSNNDACAHFSGCAANVLCVDIYISRMTGLKIGLIRFE